MKKFAREVVLFFTQPSLARRGFLFITVAFLMVWVVLMAYNYISLKSVIKNDPVLPKFAQALSDSLAGFSDPVQAISIIAATDQWVNVRRRENKFLSGRVQFALYDQKGSLLYHSPALGHERLNLQAIAYGHGTFLGLPHVIAQAHTRHWQVVTAEPSRGDLQLLSINAEVLLRNLLVALPLVLLTVWLSVRIGLRPLHHMAKAIRSRHESDLTPLDFKSKHSELQPLLGSLDALLIQLNAKVQGERAFLQDAAHELRTPIAVIAAQGHVLANAESASERQQAKTHLEQAIERTSHLAEQLLALAALDDSKESQLRTFDLAAWVRQSLAQESGRAIAKKIELSLDAPDELMVRIDRDAFESISRNLLDNAIRYTPASGTIRVHLSEVVATVSFTVEDDGIGITTQDVPRVFERFFRGAGHSESGSGLGLAIAKQAAQRIRGAIQVSAGIQGRGAGFRVNFPKYFS
jgi:two-component system, OmpR family, sensor histidine kinase QseC